MGYASVGLNDPDPACARWPGGSSTAEAVIASGFGFAVLILDSGASVLTIGVIRWTIRAADGDPDRLVSVFTVLGPLIVLPTVLIGTYLLAVTAGHRLGERTRRWILLGMGIYTVVRIATVLASSPSPELGVTPGGGCLGAVVAVPLLACAALLGARRARKTQAAYYAKAYFRRLPPADQEAALALLDEAVPRRS